MSAERLYFVQHGLAVDKAVDPESPLSKTGIDRTEAIARLLDRSDISVSQVFHSGKLRALQTAEIFASVLNINSISAIDHLSPNDDVTSILKNLNINNALYVGHLPHLEKLVAYLVTNEINKTIINFQNSGIVCLKNGAHTYHIEWYLSPDLLPR